MLFTATLMLIKPGLITDAIDGVCIALSIVWRIRKTRIPELRKAGA